MTVGRYFVSHKFEFWMDGDKFVKYTLNPKNNITKFLILHICTNSLFPFKFNKELTLLP